LQTIDDGFGYWVKVTNSVELYSSGACINKDSLEPLDLGWNLIAYITNTPQPPNTYIPDLLTGTQILEFATGFNGATKTFDPDLAGPFNTLQQMENGFGYWVKIENSFGQPETAKNLYSNTPPDLLKSIDKANATLENDITVIPNPVTSKATIILKSKFSGNASIHLYDMYGRKIANVTKTDINLNETNSFEFNAENLSSSMYILKVISKEEASYKTIIVE